MQAHVYKVIIFSQKIKPSFVNKVEQNSKKMTVQIPGYTSIVGENGFG